MHTATVTLTYVDTLTRGVGRESGDPWIVHVLSELLCQL